MYWLFEPRSKIDDYDDPNSGGNEPGCLKLIAFSPIFVLFMVWVAILPYLAMAVYFLHDVYTNLKRTVYNGELAYPSLTGLGIFVGLVLALNGYHLRPTVFVLSAMGFVLFFTILPLLALSIYHLENMHAALRNKFGAVKTYLLYIGIMGIGVGFLLGFFRAPSLGNIFDTHPANTSELASRNTAFQTAPIPKPASTSIPTRAATILVDDFKPQPYQGDETYYYNRLDGDRGALNDSLVTWGDGQVTATISTGNVWGGIWMSLDHPIREGLAVDFSAVLPAPILPAYQSKITGIGVQIAGGTPGRLLRIELKDGSQLAWKYETLLRGSQQVLSVALPPLQNISQLLLVLDHANAGDKIVVDWVVLTSSSPILDTAKAAFVWSYGMLLNNWNATTGLVRDKAKDASGEFDAIQATGSLAAATAIADQLGIVSHVEAVRIVSKIGQTLLSETPKNHGLWPHWVKISPAGKIEIAPDSEWSSVDTVIAAIGLLDAQQALGLDTSLTEQFLQAIEWDQLITDKGISHGFTATGERIPYAWDTFGGESWLADLAYTAATGKVPALAYPSGQTANGSGFIDELAWLYVLPPSEVDYWGRDWSTYRLEAAQEQISYFTTHAPDSCIARLGWFGLSAAEVPSPAQVSKTNIYQAFGLGGQFAPLNDGSILLGSPVIVPHYSALIATLQPGLSTKMWDGLINQGLFSPLNNVESLTFPVDSDCDPESIEWNALKGSWNLSLQTLGWGRYLAEQDGQVPILWLAAKANSFLRQGYQLLAPNDPPASLVNPEAWDNQTTITPISASVCTGESLYRWQQPGIYRYRIIDENNILADYSMEHLSRYNAPQNGSCTRMPWVNYGEQLSDPPDNSLYSQYGKSSCLFDGTVPGVEMSIALKGVESITTRFGAFQAMRVESTGRYNFPNFFNYPRGEVTATEWYVCGYGVISAKIIHDGQYQPRQFHNVLTFELISFTPFP